MEGNEGHYYHSIVHGGLAINDYEGHYAICKCHYALCLSICAASKSLCATSISALSKSVFATSTCVCAYLTCVFALLTSFFALWKFLRHQHAIVLCFFVLCQLLFAM